jgi:broad specificity phosphatase PhoE
MTAPDTSKVVFLQDIAVFSGTEDEARKLAYSLVVQIRDKHTFDSRARRAFVTAGALAILRGAADEFRPETSRSPWTVTVRDEKRARKGAAA